MIAPNPVSEPLPADVVAAMHKGEKIEAIKRLRVARNLGLKEAKDIVDDYMHGDPALARKYRHQSAGVGQIARLLALAVAAALGYWMFFGK